ncbi:MAG: lysophospholipid acyltransferase family protein [Myxococcota bacterium]
MVLLRLLLIGLYAVFWGGMAALVGPFDRSGEFGVFAARRFIRWVLASCRVEVDVAGLGHIDPDRSYVVMANHQSLFDIAAIVATLPLSFRFVAKRELTRIPFFGWGLVAAGHVIVDRGNTEASVRSLRRAAERVRSGVTVIIFPEGTRSRTGELRRFRSGGFHLAMEAGVAILPATVSGSQRINQAHSLRVEPGRMHVTYGEPIPTDRWPPERRAELIDRVRAAILAGFDPAYQEGRDAEDPGRRLGAS